LLVGNAGPAMFDRFCRECDPETDLLDDWTRRVLSPVAASMNAKPVFPFDRPYPPFLTWARAAGTTYPSPLGLNIHPRFGLWHAFRAAFMFSRTIDFPAPPDMQSPCTTCRDKPCLSACPAGAFTGEGYDVAASTGHLSAPAGEPCRTGGCLARTACPVGRDYAYTGAQTRFHMVAFMTARALNPGRLA
jgi:hypothetical protein